MSGFPFGQLPVLEWGDLQIAQTFTIARYVAKKIGLAGKDAEEDARIDMISDHVSDFSFRHRTKIVLSTPFL